MKTAARDRKCLFGMIGLLLDGVLTHKAVCDVYRTYRRLIRVPVGVLCNRRLQHTATLAGKDVTARKRILHLLFGAD
jgi:hypothetical protein